jgi:hypothetical protein
MSKPNNPVRYIILDTCIFEHLGNEELAQQIVYLLRDAVSKSYMPAMSIFTLLELIDTATIENEIKAMNAVGRIKRFPINQTVLVAAGRMGCFYKDDGIDKQPEKGDKIIAAVSVLNNAVVFTTNGRDFPEPFFRTISTPYLKYRKKDGREVVIIGYFKEPNLEVISAKHSERMRNTSS